MIQVGSYLTVIDNSGAKKVVCIRINTNCKKRYAFCGENIVVSVKSLRSTRRHFSKVKKGEVLNALVVMTKIKKDNFYNTSCSFFDNSVILLTKQNKLLGTRVFGGLSKNLRFTKYMKILALASGIIF